VHRLAPAHSAPRRRHQQNDLVGWSEERFEEIRDEFEVIPAAPRHQGRPVHPDQRAPGRQRRSNRRVNPWYPGPTLLNHLETVHIGSDWNLRGFRLPVQWVNARTIRPIPACTDFPWFQRAGSPAAPSASARKWSHCRRASSSRVQEIWTFNGAVEEAFCRNRSRWCSPTTSDVSRGNHDHRHRRSLRREHRSSRQGLLDAPAPAPTR